VKNLIFITICIFTVLSLKAQATFIVIKNSEVNLTRKKDSIYSKAKHSEGYIINGEKGGYWIFYDEYGQISSAGQYLNNLKVGYWKFYNKNGTLEKQGEYYNNKKNNYWFFYSTTGKLSSEGNFNEDLKDGYWKNYNNHEIIVSEGTYAKNHMEGFWKFYSDNKLIKEGWVSVNKPISYWNIYHENGTFSHQINYSED